MKKLENEIEKRLLQLDWEAIFCVDPRRLEEIWTEEYQLLKQQLNGRNKK